MRKVLIFPARMLPAVCLAAALLGGCGSGDQLSVAATPAATPHPATATVVVASRPESVMPRPPELKVLPLTLEQGAALYGARCGNCHGLIAISGGTIPDLRYMTPDTHGLFNDIVLVGSRAGNGMPGFADVLSEFDANAVHAYVISRARDTYTGD